MLKKEEITQEVLDKVKSVELEILVVVRDFCKVHGIKYSLTAGTMLGAVRHGGFIPWDDDIDIMMDRNNYNKFIEKWNYSHPSGYLIQNKETDHEFSQAHCKVKKDHTTFLQDGEDKFKYHKGIFIDVFPMDKGWSFGIKGKIFRLKGMLFLLYTRGFVPEESGSLTRLVSKILLSAVPRKKYFGIAEKIKSSLMKCDGDSSLPTFSFACMEDFYRAYPCDLLSHFETAVFEGEEFTVSARKEEFLKMRYGEYMLLPPEEQRVWLHKPIIIDFNKNFEELNLSDE